MSELPSSNQCLHDYLGRERDGYRCQACGVLMENENAKLRTRLAAALSFVPDHVKLSALRSAVETPARPNWIPECEDLLARALRAEARLAKWEEACTGRHGSQAPCLPLKTGREPAFDPDVRVLSSEEVARGLTLNNIATFAYPPWHRKRYCDSGLRLMGISDTRPDDARQAQYDELFLQVYGHPNSSLSHRERQTQAVLDAHAEVMRRMQQESEPAPHE
jgi:hypothetical protein